MYCKYCGKELDGTEAFCKECGNPVNDRPGNVGMPAGYNGGYRRYIAGPKKKHSAIALIAAVTCALIIVMSVIVYFPEGFNFHKQQERGVAAGTGSTSLAAQESEEISDPAAETTTAAEASAETEQVDEDSYNEEITTNQLLRTPDQYIGEKIVVTGECNIVSEIDDETYIYIETDDYASVCGTIQSDQLEQRVLRFDRVTLYGTFDGLDTSYSFGDGIIEVSVDKVVFN